MSTHRSWQPSGLPRLPWSKAYHWIVLEFSLRLYIAGLQALARANLASMGEQKNWTELAEAIFMELFLKI